MPKSSHTTPVLKSLHWLKINERIKYKLLSLTYTVFQKSDAKIEITITTTNLIRIRYPHILLAALIIAFLVQTLQILTKSTAQFLSNTCFKKWNSKTEASNMEKSP